MIEWIAALIICMGGPAGSSRQWARWIAVESQRYDIPAEMVAAVITVESRWSPRAKSVTHDFGLGQIHVSSTNYPEFRGREHLLFDPRINIRYTAKTLRMWKNYHDRACGVGHPWWAHYKWGYRVRSLDWAIKVEKIIAGAHNYL